MLDLILAVLHLLELLHHRNCHSLKMGRATDLLCRLKCRRYFGTCRYFGARCPGTPRLGTAQDMFGSALDYAFTPQIAGVSFIVFSIFNSSSSAEY